MQRPNTHTCFRHIAPSQHFHLVIFRNLNQSYLEGRWHSPFKSKYLSLQCVRLKAAGFVFMHYCLHLFKTFLPHFRQSTFLQKMHDRLHLQTFVRLTSTVANSPQANQKRKLSALKTSRGSALHVCRILRAVIPEQKESASRAVAHTRARDTSM